MLNKTNDNIVEDLMFSKRSSQAIDEEPSRIIDIVSLSTID